MPEIRKVEAQQMDQKCPACNNGWMRPTGIIEGNPPQHQHKCNSCGHQQNYGMQFPYTIG